MQVDVRHLRGHLGLLLLLAACGGSGGVTTPPPPAAVASVTLSQAAATLTPQQTVTLTATTKDASGNILTGRSISWSTSNATVATVNGGLVTAVAVGSATVTATSEGQSGGATITVAAVVVPVATVTLNQGAATLVPGQPLTLVAATKDGSGNVLTGRGITWSSTATGVASVDGNGAVTAIAAGTTTITATSEGKSAAATITVNTGAFLGPAGGTASGFSGNATVTIPAGALGAGLAITIAQVTNPQADPKLAPGTAYDFGPTGTTFSAPVTLAIKYDPATLAAGTTQANLRVHKLIGTTWTPLAGSSVNTITHVVSGATSSFSTYAVLEVIIPVSIVAITPNPVDLPLGMQVQLTATTKDAQGNVLTGRTVTWQSSTGATASIGTSTGLVTSNATGATTITATSEGVPVTMTLNVRNDPSARTLELDRGSGATFVPARGIVVIPGTATASCAIGIDQKGYCWGQGGAAALGGQFPFPGGLIGDGTGLDRSVPTAIALPNSLVAIAPGGGFTCALDTSHQAWCWGDVGVGFMGNGAFNDPTPTPARAAIGHLFTDLSVGESHVCGIDFNNGGTYCWGRNDLGSLGIGFITPANGIVGVLTPTRIIGDPGLVTISVGGYGACGLTSLGIAYCWGGVGAIDPPLLSATLVPGAVPFARIARGYDHACGLTVDHKIYCWGYNDGGQLGNGGTTRQTTPVLVSGGFSWRFVSAGNQITCGITTDNRTFCWGGFTGASFATEGQNGNGTATGSLTPVQVTGVPALATVSAGFQSGCGLTADGSGYCWGIRGDLGDGDYFYSAGPVQVAGPQTAQDVGRGSPMGCYVSLTKQLMCWAETEDATSPHVPSFGALAVKAVNLAGVFSGSFACVIRDSDSRVSCWGDNTYGQLGNGTTTPSTVPVLIASANTFTMLATGYAGACGITTNKGLFCWGASPGTTTSSSTPVQVLPGINWVSVWGGDTGGFCAISDQGAAYCGNVPSAFALVPGTQHWTMMAPGNQLAIFTGSTTCGITDTGDAYCMGDNSYGQLGDGTVINHNTMAPVIGGLKFTQIVAERFAMCAMTAAGAVYCWGDGTQGKMGAVPGASSTQPVLVPGGLHFTKISGSSDGTCGVTSDGSVYCWGVRFNSSLGNGELDDRRSPVPMAGGKRFLLYEPGSPALRAQRVKQP